MKSTKIEDAHNFIQNVRLDNSLGPAETEAIRADFTGFINENYVLKSEEVNNIDYINNKPVSQI